MFKTIAISLILMSLPVLGCRSEWYDPSDMTAAPGGMVTRAFTMFCKYPSPPGGPCYNEEVITFSLPDNGLPVYSANLHIWTSCDNCNMSITVDPKWRIVDDTAGVLTNTLALQSGENQVWLIARETDDFFCGSSARSLVAAIRTHESEEPALEIVKDAALLVKYCEDGCNGGDPDRPLSHSCCFYDIPWYAPPDYHLDRLCFTSDEYYQFFP